MTRLPLTEAIGLALKTFREGAGFTVPDAAAATGLTEGVIRSREAGTNVEAPDVCTLATAYGVDFIQVWSLGQLLHMGDGTAPAPPSSPPPPPDVRSLDWGILTSPTLRATQLRQNTGTWNQPGRAVVPLATVLGWVQQGEAGDEAGMRAAIAAWAANPPT